MHTGPSIVGALAIVVCAAAAAFANAEESPERPEVKAWFTAEQAERGEAAYERECSECHGADLLGETAPPLAGSGLGYENAGWLYDYFSNDMPLFDPGSLSPETATDILTYILSVNGHPTGETELPPDPDLFFEIDI